VLLQITNIGKIRWECQNSDGEQWSWCPHSKFWGRPVPTFPIVYASA